MHKKIVAILMMVMFVFNFTGCRDKKAGTIQTFEETDLGKAAGLDIVYGARVNSKNQLVVLITNKEKEFDFITLDSGGNELSSLKCNLKVHEAYFTIDMDDNLYVLTQNYTMDEYEKDVKEIDRQLIQYDADGKEVKRTDLGIFIPEDNYTGVAGFEVDLSGNIYLLKRQDYIEVFDKKGRNMGSIGTQGYSCMSMDSEGCLVLGSDGAGGKNSKIILEKIETPKGENVWKKDFNNSGIPRLIRENRTDKMIYVLTNQGVKKYTSSGTDNGYIFDTKQTSLLGFDSFITSMDVDSTGCCYFTVSKNANPSGTGQPETGLYKYTPLDSDNKTETGQITLTLNTVKTSQFLENAISEFQREYPGIKIEIKESSTDGTEEGFSNYVTTLNTELMSSNGPDLISATGLPNHMYISRGFYANLSSMIEKDREFNLKQYKTNLFDSFKYNGIMYVMPINVYGDTIAVNQTILDEENIKINDENWTWEDFLEVCKKVTKDMNGDGTPERYAIPNIGISTMFIDIFRNSYYQFIDWENKKAYFDSPEFIALLKTVKGYLDSNVICPDRKAVNLSDELFDLYDRNGIVFIPTGIYGYATMGFFSENTEFLQPPSVNGIYKPTYYSDVFAINDKSKYRAEAWTFIKFLLSENTQKQRVLNGFVINKKADEFRWNEELSISRTGRMRGPTGRRVLLLTDAMLNTVDRLTAKTGVLPYIDQRINLIIQQEANNFFTGRKSAEEAVKIMLSKVNTYLSE